MDVLDYDTLYIAGEWRKSSGTDRVTVISPNDEERVGSAPAGTAADVDAAVAAARSQLAAGGWASWSVQERASALHRFADRLETVAADVSWRVSAQNGMPISMSRGIERFPVQVLRYYADLAEATAADERRLGPDGSVTVVARDPVGVIAAIVPWNGPQVQSMIKIAPALAAGCSVVLKPAPEAMLDSFLLAQAAHESGLPPGVLSIIPGDGELGAYLVSHPGVDKVSFTGSTAAGRLIAAECGRLIRPVTLELGGKSAAIVLDDADLGAHLDGFFDATMAMSGQICHLGTRVLVPRSRHREMVDAVSDLASSAVIGESLDPKTRVGPLVSARQRQRVEDYIELGRAAGATITVGGGRPAGRDTGWFLSPTVFTDVEVDAVIAREEIFGPVLTVIPYRDDDEAVAIANDSAYGLGGTVWTADPERGEALAKRISTGTIGVNFYANDPNAPFGGVRDSGLGRELGPEGLAAVQVLKSIYVRPGDAQPSQEN
ncbi:aldehyde dehydrogenase (plasmid) [Rhodococcus sp. USK10]|uniref:aldehyde dehydrogenase n=1 Tax=Rhodococcus sp. USK10 TaxID=2789739 RepID=UPI001C60241E|nr:aldehyde dehydrogenase [Rhodococcus sp. USK10]QYB00183.1 aldehyde dehydrogenase [Rhodococcus sp. USK10]